MIVGIIGIVGIKMGGIGIARNRGKGLNVGNRQLPRQARDLTNTDLVIGDVFNHFSDGGLVHLVLFQATAWQPAST